MRIALLLLLISGVHQANSLFKDRPLRTRKAATGPCTLNEDGLKCNENGYYETVQCNKDSCFCVTPHTGLIAFETRTNSPKTAPKCGACIGYLQKLFANGDTPDNSFIPKCDAAKGDFDPVQCDSSKNQCYCVDTDTGRETPGTRQPFNSTKNINCMKIDFSIDSKLFPKFEKPDVTKPKPSLPVGRPWCGKDRHPGCTCRENKTSIRYWFDFETYSCLAFEHQGCGGNRNSYRTYGECISDCALQDFFSCALQSQPARKSNGEWYPCPEGAPPPPGVTTTTTPGPKLDHYGCPKGYICMMGPFFGLCCEESLTIRYQDAFDTKCKNNKPKLQMIHHDSCSDLFGKSCSDNFCPRTHTCEHNEFVAYCCPK